MPTVTNYLSAIICSKTTNQKGHEDDPRDGAPLLGELAERVGAIQPEEEKALG